MSGNTASTPRPTWSKHRSADCGTSWTRIVNANCSRRCGDSGMFWNRIPRWLDTLRAKMYGINAALILLAFLLSSTGIYFFQRNYLLGEIEEKITIFSHEFEYEYLTGEEEMP